MDDLRKGMIEKLTRHIGKIFSKRKEIKVRLELAPSVPLDN